MADLALAFDGIDVRTRLIDGEPCVLLADVIAVLEMKSSPSQVAQRLPEGVRKTDPLETAGGIQNATWLTEPGFYRVALRSNSAKAEALIQWVTEEVLPQIRKTGSYGAVPAIEVPTTMVEALELALNQAREIEEKSAALAIAAPKADAFDAFLSAAGDYSVRDAVKVLNRDHAVAIREKALYAWLQEHRWIYRDSGRNWCGYADAVASGYVAHKAQWHYHPETGEKVIDPAQLRITAAGIDRLRIRLTKAA